MAISVAAAVDARRVALRVNPGPPALLLAMLIWGGTLVVTKSLLNDLDPATLLSVRFLVAFLCLVPFAYRGGFRMRDLVRREFVLFGLTGIVLHNGLETWGLRYTSAGSAALIIAGIPAITVALSRVFLKERLPRARTLGVALSVAGVALVTRPPSGEGALELAGNLLVFGGVVAWAVYTVQGKKMSVRVPAIVGTTAGTGAALLFLLPAAVVESWGDAMPAIGLADGAGLLYLGLGASAAAYALWNFALEHVDASVAAPYVNLVPIIGLALAMFLGESMAPPDLAGGAIVAAGVWLSTSRRFAPVPATAEARGPPRRHARIKRGPPRRHARIKRGPPRRDARIKRLASADAAARPHARPRRKRPPRCRRARTARGGARIHRPLDR